MPARTICSQQSDRTAPVPLFSLSNAWEVQASPGDSNGTGDAAVGTLPGAQRAVGCQQPLCSLPQLPAASQLILTSSSEPTGCQQWVPGQERLEAKGSTDGSTPGSHPGQSGAWPAPAPLPLSLLESPRKSKGWRESSVHSQCLFKALIPAQMTPVLCVPTAPSCPEETKPRAIAKPAVPTLSTAIRRYFTINVLLWAHTLSRKALRIHSNFMLSHCSE